ncbi:MAG: hypothetical protein AB7N76_05810 [Planctomycetota bacterium]
MNSTSRELLKIALDRGYLDADVVRRVAREAKTRRVSPERVLLERRLLSVRRMERLRTHLRYRVTRQGDKAYAAVAARSGLVSLDQLRAALKYQKTLFTTERRCIRVGSRLIEQGLLTVDQDRKLRARSHALAASAPARKKGQQDASSTQALPLDEESRLRSRTGDQPPASYAAIEAALARVDAIRALQEDLSTSERSLPSEQLATPDSAEEFENALATLARRRVGASPDFHGEEQPRRRRAKKKASKLLAIFDAA